MNHDDLHRLVVRVLATRDDELDFDGAEGGLAEYVDATARGENDPARYGRMTAHLAQAPETADVLETLVALAAMERSGGLPDLDALWDEVRSAARPPAPARPVAPRQVVAERPTPWWQALASRLATSPSARAFVPVTAVLAVMVTSAGWWRAEQAANHAATELRDLQTALSRIDATSVGAANRFGISTAPQDVSYRTLVETVGSARENRFALGADGAWARVSFAPGNRRALVWAGSLPPLADGKHYECYLVDADGGRHRVRLLEHMYGDAVWWHIEADQAVDAYATLAMAGSPGDEAVVQVALAEE